MCTFFIQVGYSWEMLTHQFQKWGTVNAENIVSRSAQVKWQDTDVFGNGKCRLENSTTACPPPPHSWGVISRKKEVSPSAKLNPPCGVNLPSVYRSMQIAFRSLFHYKQGLNLQEWCPMPPINLQYFWKWGITGFWSPCVLIIVHHPAYFITSHQCIAYAPRRGPGQEVRSLTVHLIVFAFLNIYHILQIYCNCS